LFFYCNDGSATFSDVRIISESDSDLAPKNEITKAQDAILKVNGIQISRDRNTEIDDAIKGVHLDLRRASREIVEIRVDNDIEQAVTNIKRFVEAYNSYIDFNRELIRTEIIDSPGEFNNPQNEKGVFAGDMTIIQIENIIKRVVNGAYPNLAENQIRILPQMGISTGRINASWENIRLGKLIIDEDELRRTILENPQGVRDFFGADTTGDNRINTGMAFTLEETLKQYVGFGRNIIVLKIDSENESIKRTNERIARKHDQLRRHEEKLRAQFARMESAVSQARMQRNWMNQNMREDR
jgi:flagellar hook-associated protein 2